VYTKIYKQDELPPNLFEELEKIDLEGLASYLSDPFTFSIAAVYNEQDKLVAVGFSRAVEEYKLIVNPDSSSREKAIAIRDLMTLSTHLTKCNEVIVFITKGSEHYENFLKKHFGFHNRDGVPLALEV